MFAWSWTLGIKPDSDNVGVRHEIDIHNPQVYG